jgi:SAM-dependent methyltransferase
MSNSDKNVVKDFGDEWDKYPQSSIDNQSLKSAFNQYFSIFPFDDLPKNAEGYDMGCGSGRWAQFVAPRVHKINCIDPSAKALNVARKNLAAFSNTNFVNASVDKTKINSCTQDFGYCLGVLHHIPNTLEGLKDCADLLKPGAPFLLYLYYKFDDKPLWFKLLYKLSNLIRIGITSWLPFYFKSILTFFIACLVYYPLARMALILEKVGINIENFPLNDYRDKPFYFMKTDSLDRFGTKLEKRFSKKEITDLLDQAGFEKVFFSEKMPKWVCIAYKK